MNGTLAVVLSGLSLFGSDWLQWGGPKLYPASSQASKLACGTEVPRGLKSAPRNAGVAGKWNGYFRNREEIKAFDLAE